MFELRLAGSLYCLVVGVVFVSLWLYYDKRDNARNERDARKGTFHCIRCDMLYASTSHADRVACPQCKHMNARLRF
jgi:protein-arginine kinase activator protein McsA